MVVSSGIYLTIRYGLRPKPIPVLNPTSFAQLKQIGVVIYKRLHQNVRAERLVVLGSDQAVKDYDQVWSGFTESALADKEKLVFVREGMKSQFLPAGAEVIRFTEQQLLNGEFFQDIARRLQKKQLVVVHSWAPEVTHLVKNSLSQRLDPVVHHPVLSVSALRFAIDQAEVDQLQPQCLDATATAGADGLERLRCAAYKVARKFLKKQLDGQLIWAVAERHGLKEYLLFIHQP